MTPRRFVTSTGIGLLVFACFTIPPRFIAWWMVWRFPQGIDNGLLTSVTASVMWMLILFGCYLIGEQVRKGNKQ